MSRRLVAITVDYETWQPIPEGREIDWEADVLDPTARLLDTCDAAEAPLTLMVEMGEYFWLAQHNPDLAQRMEAQWREAVARGHDVQLHLHPNWLPELGATQVAGRWTWDWSRGRISDYPGDVASLLARCRDRLETVIRPVEPSFRVSCFRAGAYEAQPFERLHAGLLAAEIECDTSVYAGGRRADRSYDYSLGHSDHRPYFASRIDPQLAAPPAEGRVVELPVFAFRPGQTWTFDSDRGSQFARQLIDYAERRLRPPRTHHRSDPLAVLRLRALRGHARLGRARRPLNCVIPRACARALVPPSPPSGEVDDCFVLIGHTKGDLDMGAIAAGVGELKGEDFRFVTLSEMASSARAQLAGASTVCDGTPAAEARSAIEHDPAVARALLDRMPLDCESVLDLGRGIGAALTVRYPWVDLCERPEGGKVDAVVALHAFEHADDVDAELARAVGALKPGGVLVAAIRSGARRPPWTPRLRAWETAPHDVRLRLKQAGFAWAEITEVDAYRTLGSVPDPSSGDRVMFVRAGVRPVDADRRADELVAWTYDRVEPSDAQSTSVPEAVVAQGAALCSGYTLALGEALRREGIAVDWISMLAHDHPRGRGPTGLESHEVIEAIYRDGRREVIDAMAGVRLGTGLAELLAHPEQADFDRPRDERYRARGYDLYATSAWYRRVVAVARRTDPHRMLRYRPAHRAAQPPADGRARALGPVGAASPTARAEWLAHRAARRIASRPAPRRAEPSKSQYPAEPPRRSLRVDLLSGLSIRLGRGGLVTPHLHGDGDEPKVQYEYDTAHTFWEAVAPHARPAMLDGKEVLDLGCGWGGKAIRYAEETGLRHITGFDLPEVYEPAASYAFAEPRKVANVTFVTGRGESVPFGDGSFDAVICDSVIEHVNDPGAVVQEVHRVLRPDGIFIARFPSIRMLGAHHLDRALTLPGAHYLASLRTWAAGLNHRLRRSGQPLYEPFDEAVRSRYTRHWVTSNLNGLDLASFRSMAAASGLRTERLEIAGVRPSRLTRRSLPRWLVATAIAWLPGAKEVLGIDIVYVARKPPR